jgi:hypothetical protein
VIPGEVHEEGGGDGHADLQRGGRKGAGAREKREGRGEVSDAEEADQDVPWAGRR